MVYLNRVVVDDIKEKLSIVEAVQIKGPKWCGKTTRAKQMAKSIVCCILSPSNYNIIFK